jgi:hypothetical protein
VVGEGTSAETVMRLMILKHIRNWSYVMLEREVRANLVYVTSRGWRRQDARRQDNKPLGLGIRSGTGQAIRQKNGENRSNPQCRGGAIRQ